MFEFCAETRFVQIKRGAVAVTPDERVYLVRGGRAVELVSRESALVAIDEQPETPEADVTRPVSQRESGE